MRRYELTDEQYAQVQDLLPKQNTGGGGQDKDGLLLIRFMVGVVFLYHEIEKVSAAIGLSGFAEFLGGKLGLP